MKKIIILILVGVFFNTLYSQNAPWDGYNIRPNAKFRTLNIFINVIYDININYRDSFPSNGDWGESYNEGVNNEVIPAFFLDLLDTVYNPNSNHGYMTRLYGESSFDSVQVIGDYVVVNVNESRVLNTYDTFYYKTIGFTAIDLININGLQTIFGHNSINDYKNGTVSIIYFSQYFIRNINYNYGGLNCGSGYGSSKMSSKSMKIDGVLYPISSLGTFQVVGSSNFAKNPTSIVIHEFAHNIFGGNEFHTSGGNHRGSSQLMPFFGVQGGFGLMGCYGSSLVSSNGYERWRVHWKHSTTPYYISARDSSNSYNQISDVTNANGQISFILRDYVTTGDAIRIKLPYKDSEYASNQYIWLENHQVGKNNKVDFFQYSNGASCRPQGKDGIYAYYQVGRDIVSGSNANINYYHERDNLKIIPAEGYWDYNVIEDNYTSTCIGEGSFNYSHVRVSENPFCGTQDQEEQFFPPDTDNVIKWTHIKEMWRKRIENQINDSLSWLGDERDAFHSYSKLNMGTNPSTCNAKTFYNALMKNNSLTLGNPNRNNQTTYLTGLSIEMIPLPDSTYRVNIRWDDYTVNNNVIWTGNICLKESLYLNSGKTIYLKQNKTLALPYRNPETGYFANFTNFKCDQNSIFVLNNSSELNIDEKSIFEIDTLASFTISDSSLLHIKGGSSFTLKKGGNFKILGTGTIIIDSLSTLTINDTIFVSNYANIIVKPGGKLILDNGVITNLHNGLPWKGIQLKGNKIYSQNGSISHQGVVIIRNSSTISNAICGVEVGNIENNHENGGIIYASNSKFVNCKNAICFYDYKNMVNGNEFANKSIFTNCSFSVDDNFFESQFNFENHITLYDVIGVRFIGCVFISELSSIDLISTSYSRIGILSFNSGFIVQPHCSENLSLTGTCNDMDIIDTSAFKGLNYGIIAFGAEKFYKIKVEKTNFNNNEVGIYISGVNNPSIKKCNFIIGRNNNHILSNPIGVLLSNSTGYKIEENNFTKNPLCTYEVIGIIIRNSGEVNNQIYKNNFSNLFIGEHLNGNNYSNSNPYSGLQTLCNTHENNDQYDILVSIDLTVSQSGINQYQNNIYNNNVVSAGNKFSNPDSIPYQFKNYTFPIVNYYYSDIIENGYEVENPQNSSSNINKFLASNYACPSRIYNPTIQIAQAVFDSISIEFANLQYNYNEIIDAGNTQELLQLIQGEWSNDVWELRDKLLLESPKLSTQILSSIAINDELPSALFLEICLANPDATKNQEFIDLISYNIPNPLPQYMINLIEASWETKTFRTILEEKLAISKTSYDSKFNEIGDFILLDSNYLNLNNMYGYLDFRSAYTDYFTKAEIAINNNDFNYAFLAMSDILTNLMNLSEYELSEVENFNEYIEIRESFYVHGQSIYNLTEDEQNTLENFASLSNYRGAVLAKNILCIIYKNCIEEIPLPPKKLATHYSNQTQLNNQLVNVNISPNPASTFTTVEWDLKTFSGNAILYIYDQVGKTVLTYPISANQGQFVWDTRNQGNGVYVFVIKSDKLTLNSGKIIVNK